VSDGTSFGRFNVPAFIIAYVKMHRGRSPLLIGDLGSLLAGLVYAIAFGPRMVLEEVSGQAVLVNRPLLQTAVVGLLRLLGRSLGSARHWVAAVAKKLGGL
jgi:hypothetical protein